MLTVSWELNTRVDIHSRPRRLRESDFEKHIRVEGNTSISGNLIMKDKSGWQQLGKRAVTTVRITLTFALLKALLTVAKLTS